MKRITAFFIALILLYHTSAQDYQVMRSDRTVFYDFHIYPYSYFSFKEIQLLGLTNPSKGVQNFIWFDVYDFQVGDEFHGVRGLDKIIEVPILSA